MDHKPEATWRSSAPGGFVEAATYDTKQIAIMKGEHRWQVMYRQWMIAKQDLPRDTEKGKFSSPSPKIRIVIGANRWLLPDLIQGNQLGGGEKDKEKNDSTMKTRKQITVKPNVKQKQKQSGETAPQEVQTGERTVKPKDGGDYKLS